MLLPARLPARALVVGAAIIALVLAGVFLPTFSMQILNGVLASAVFIVAVMWGVRRRVGCGRRAARARAARSASRRSRPLRRPRPASRPSRKRQEGGPTNA